MKKSQLSDKQLEEILGQMPKVTDHRDPRDIYQNIAHRVEKKRTPTWVLPGVAAAAVLFLAFILSSGLSDWNQSSDKSSESPSTDDAKIAMEKSADKNEDISENSPTMDNSKMAQPDQGDDQNQLLALEAPNPFAGLTALYNSELEEGEQVFTYAVPDSNVQILVPVSVIVPADGSKPWFNEYMEGMDRLKEEEWGLSDYYPFEGSLSYSEDTNELLFKVEQDHSYKHGSVIGPNFLNSVDLNFGGKGFEVIKFETGGQEGIDFGHGDILEEGKISSRQNRAFLIYESDNHHRYLVPTFEEFGKIEEAFDKMRFGNRFDKTQASIPEEWELAIRTVNDSLVVISLKDHETLTEDFLPNLEAILLTAKDFGFEAVKFENAGTDQLGPFNLNMPIEVPLAPNKKHIE